MKNKAVFSRVDRLQGKPDAFPPPMVGNGIANDFGEERVGMFDSTPLEGSDAFEQGFLGQIFQDRKHQAGGHVSQDGPGVLRRQYGIWSMTCHCSSFFRLKWEMRRGFPGAAVRPFAADCPLDAEPPGSWPRRLR